MVNPLIASKYSILFFNCIIFVIYFSNCRLVGFTFAKVKIFPVVCPLQVMKKQVVQHF